MYVWKYEIMYVSFLGNKWLCNKVSNRVGQYFSKEIYKYVSKYAISN